jgi:hypothetical protein
MHGLPVNPDLDHSPHNTFFCCGEEADPVFLVRRSDVPPPCPNQESTTMRIVFYKTRLCPRCFLARKHLLAACATHANLQIEEVELITSPLQTWRDGIKMVPALKVGETVLSGLYLSEEAIADFVAQMLSKSG